VVAVSFDGKSAEVLERRRLVVAESETRAAKQPYHFVENFELSEAEKYLAKCASTAQRMATAELRKLTRDLEGRGYKPCRGAILLAAARPLPPLAQILMAHPLIHTAEGEFFRQAFRQALEELQMKVRGIPQHDLEARAKLALGSRFADVRQNIEHAGKRFGSPWTQDQKLAALAAALVLAEGAKK
jgi:hypothetical protein